MMGRVVGGPMTPCSACGSHHRPGSSCPHCGTSTGPARSSVAALMLGLALVGCSGDKDSATTGTTGDTGDTDTTPTTGVDYGVAMMAPIELEPLVVPEEREAPGLEDAEPR